MPEKRVQSYLARTPAGKACLTTFADLATKGENGDYTLTFPDGYFQKLVRDEHGSHMEDGFVRMSKGWKGADCSAGNSGFHYKVDPLGDGRFRVLFRIMLPNRKEQDGIRFFASDALDAEGVISLVDRAARAFDKSGSNTKGFDSFLALLERETKEQPTPFPLRDSKKDAGVSL